MVIAMWDSCYKMRQKAVIWKLLQRVAEVCGNVRQVLQSISGITKCDSLWTWFFECIKFTLFYIVTFISINANLIKV